MKTIHSSMTRNTRLFVVIIACAFVASLFDTRAYMQTSIEPAAQNAVPMARAEIFSSKEAKSEEQPDEAKTQAEGAQIVAPLPEAVTATSYPFTSASGIALDDMSSGTTQLVAANQDDTASAVTNIGFDYWYDGVRTTQFSVNANGLTRLGATVISNGFTNSLASTTDAPKIGAFLG